MKTCPHCNITVGGAHETCPLCQNPLIGEATGHYFPKVEPALRRVSLVYKIIVFIALSATVICAAADFLFDDEPHMHWSIVVLAVVIAGLALLRTLMKRRYNAPRLLFQVLIGSSVLALFLDWFIGWTGYSYEFAIPTLCMITLVVNFVLAFVNKRFTENGLIYLLLNMLVGVVPYIALMILHLDRTTPWIVCLVISVITFLGLVIFKWRALWSEFEKRLHM